MDMDLALALKNKLFPGLLGKIKTKTIKTKGELKDILENLNLGVGVEVFVQRYSSWQNLLYSEDYALQLNRIQGPNQTPVYAFKKVRI